MGLLLMKPKLIFKQQFRCSLVALNGPFIYKHAITTFTLLKRNLNLSMWMKEQERKKNQRRAGF
jgi:hypothetical protein